MPGSGEIVCDPIFTRRDFPSGDGGCFVIMPFHDSLLEDVYRNSVKPPILEMGIPCSRGDDIFGVSAIMEDIWSAICTADFILAEFTGRNPNVLYEAGIAHTLGKPVICLTQRIEDVPFDFRHIRHIVYSTSPSGYRKLASDLKATVQFLLDERRGTLPRPASNERVVEQIVRTLQAERQRSVEMYTAIEARTLRAHEHYRRVIASHQQTGWIPTARRELEVEFCTVPSMDVSVDSYDEEEQHIVSLGLQHVESFQVSKYPVTNELFVQFVAESGHPPPEDWQGDRPPDARAKCAAKVSWADIVGFCGWYKEWTGLEVGLPNEAQWLAASGYALDKRLFPWGHTWRTSACNSAELKRRSDTTVDLFESTNISPFGCVDMLGNLWEWTRDSYVSDENAFPWRAVRGGAYYSNLSRSGVLSRLVAFPGHFLLVNDICFRIVHAT